MRFLLALLFAYTIALIGASVYAHPASVIVKRGSEAPDTIAIADGLLMARREFCDCCAQLGPNRATCCKGKHRGCSCLKCNPPFPPAAMEKGDEDVLAAERDAMPHA